MAKSVSTKLKDKLNGNKELLSTREYLIEVILPALLYCLIAGVFTGFLISLYGFIAGWLIEKSAYVYALVRENPEYSPLLFLGLAVLALIMTLLLKHVPEVKGSGIPRTEGILRGLLTFRWLRVILGTIVGSFISFFAGLSLGNEGPSVQLGAATAEGANSLFKSKFAWRRYVSTGGAAAGIAVAFGAPITGIMFAVEELQRQFNPLLLFSAVVTTLSATATAMLCAPIFGFREFFFDFVAQLKSIPIGSSWMLVIIAVICGLAAVIFNALLISKPLIKDNGGKYTLFIKVLVAFLTAGAAGLLLADSVGPGLGLIERIADISVSLKLLFILIAVMAVLTLISYRSGATGGLFLPMLTLGALLGGLTGKMCLAMGLPEEYYVSIVMISMCAFLGATIRAPFTSLLLLIETTHSISGFLSAAIVVFLAYIVAEICVRKPLYDVLLEKEISDYNKDKPPVYCTFEKFIEADCFAEHKYIRNVLWPQGCRITSIVRDGESIVPDGTALLNAGDIVKVSCNCYDEAETEKELNSLVVCSKRKRKKSDRADKPPID